MIERDNGVPLHWRSLPPVLLEGATECLDQAASAGDQGPGMVPRKRRKESSASPPPRHDVRPEVTGRCLVCDIIVWTVLGCMGVEGFGQMQCMRGREPV